MTGSSPGMPRAAAPPAIQTAMSALGAVSPGYGVVAGHASACASATPDATGATRSPATKASPRTLVSRTRTR